MSQPPWSENAKITAQGGDNAESSTRSLNALSKLTEDQKKELVRKNEVAKKLADSFIKSGVWNWNDIKCTSDISTFAHYNLGYQVKCLKHREEIDEDTQKRKIVYTDETYMIDGAEYRYNLALMRGFGAHHKLDAESEKLVFQEIFGQDSMPEVGSKELKEGLLKCLDIQRIVGAEYNARPLAPDDKSKEKQPMNTNPVTSSRGQQPDEKWWPKSLILYK